MEDDDLFMDEGPTAAEDALFSVVPALLSGLRLKASEEEQVESLLQLAQLVDTSFGGRAMRLCSLIAKEGGVAHLAALVAHEREWLHQTSMLVLGNLASDSQDVEDALKASGLFENLLPHLFSDNAATVTFALGAVRNVCGDPDYVSAMQRQGAMRRLQVRDESTPPPPATPCMQPAAWLRWRRPASPPSQRPFPHSPTHPAAAAYAPARIASREGRSCSHPPSRPPPRPSYICTT